MKKIYNLIIILSISAFGKATVFSKKPVKKSKSELKEMLAQECMRGMENSVVVIREVTALQGQVLQASKQLMYQEKDSIFEWGSCEELQSLHEAIASLNKELEQVRTSLVEKREKIISRGRRPKK